MVWLSHCDALPLQLMGTQNLFTYLFCFVIHLNGFTQVVLDRTEKEYIKTVQFSNLQQNDAFPIAALNEKILLKFDDLGKLRMVSSWNERFGRSNFRH